MLMSTNALVWRCMRCMEMALQVTSVDGYIHRTKGAQRILNENVYDMIDIYSTVTVNGEQVPESPVIVLARTVGLAMCMLSYRKCSRYLNIRSG